MLQACVLVSLTVSFVSSFSFSFMFLFVSLLVSVSFFLACILSLSLFHLASVLCTLRLVCGQQSKLISQQVLAAVLAK